MKYLALVLIVSFALPCYAEQKVFYDKTKNAMVTDMSGKKTIEQIKEEFNLSNVQEITINEREETGRIDIDGNLIKHNFVEEAEKIKTEKDKQEKVKKDKAKLELKNLGISEETIKTIIKED